MALLLGLQHWNPRQPHTQMRVAMARQLQLEVRKLAASARQAQPVQVLRMRASRLQVGLEARQCREEQGQL